MAVNDLPGKRLYQLAIIVAVAGLVGSFAWFNYAWSDQTNAVNEFQVLPPMSGIPFEVEEAGTYTVWAGAACGGRCPVPSRAELDEFMILGFEGPDGMIRPEPFPGEQQYRLSGARHGKAAWIVEFEEAGTYVLERRNLGVGSVQLLLGEGVGLPSRILTGVYAIGGIAAALSLTLFLIGRRRRRTAVDAMIRQVHGGS